jgi:hypothetical protein
VTNVRYLAQPVPADPEGSIVSSHAANCPVEGPLPGIDGRACPQRSHRGMASVAGGRGSASIHRNPSRDPLL